MTKLEQLKSMLADGSFHHATYRNQGTIWEGLWIYQKHEQGHRGFGCTFAFLKSDLDLVDAEQLTSRTGVSVGSYGKG